MDLVEKIINEELKYEGNFLKFTSLDVELPDGNKGNRDIIRHPGASAILAFLDDETVLLVEQFRAALDRVLIEIPAGKLEKGEDPKVCAIRELEEETGFKSDNIEYLGKILFLIVSIVKSSSLEEFSEFIILKLLHQYSL